MRQELIQKVIQLIKFAFVGGLNTVLSLCIYYVLIYFNIDYLVSTIIGYIGSSIVGYTLNRVWVFNAKETKVINSVLKYCVVYSSSLLINMGCMFIFVNIMEISEILAPILTLCITVPYNYILSRLWIFNNTNQRK